MKIARLLARHLQAAEKGRAHYEKAASALEEALACAPPLDAAITLRSGETVMIVDNLGGRNAAFHGTRFKRFSVKPWRAPKPLPLEEETAAA